MAYLDIKAVVYDPSKVNDSLKQGQQQNQTPKRAEQLEFNICET
jgi:hypothetical protein